MDASAAARHLSRMAHSSMTPKERQERAQRAARARWGPPRGPRLGRAARDLLERLRGQDLVALVRASRRQRQAARRLSLLGLAEICVPADPGTLLLRPAAR